MPTVNLVRDHLFEALGETFTDEQFDHLCFEFGLELDDITSERQILKNERGAEDEAVKAASDAVIYKIEVPANRYDLLCVEGLVRALQVFRGRIPAPRYTTIAPTKPETEYMIVKSATSPLRPFVVCAILRGVTFTQERYQSFIDLQDKLHQNICRKRTLVAIGTHDLDTIQGPFTYDAQAPADIRFVPLNQPREFNCVELFEHYRKNDVKLRQFLHIVESSPAYPVIRDANGTVLSLPPIINGNHSKITLATRNVLIECTATDLTKAYVVLNTMVTSFSQYTSEPFTVEQVQVRYEQDGRVDTTPVLSTRTMDVDISYISSSVGVEIAPEQAVLLLNKMMLPAKLVDGGKQVQVEIGPDRSDVLHPCDVMEDVAVAYNINKIPKIMPKTVTVASQQPINKLADMLRQEFASSGYCEVLTLALCSHDENFKFLKKADDGKSAVVLSNPQTVEFQVCRTSLIPGMLKTLSCNQSNPLPIKLFEISDVVLLDPSKDVGARNERRMAALHCSNTSGFEFIHGLLDRTMELLRIPLSREGEAKGYYIKASENPTFFPGRQAQIFVNGKAVGHFGIVHPEVLGHFEIPNPVSLMEMQVEPFL